MHYQLETQRLIIRPWKSSDLSEFAAMSLDSEVMRYFPNLLDTQQSAVLARRIQDLIHQYGWGFWALELKATQQFIGFTGLNTLSTEFDFSSSHKPAVEIGWRITQAYWRQGYALEAAQACLKFAFTQLSLDEVYAFTAVSNQASEKLMQKLGMTFNKYFAHPNLASDHPLSQHVLYQLNAAQFSTQCEQTSDFYICSQSSLQIATI